MTTNEILAVLREDFDMMGHGFFVQCVTDGVEIEFEPRAETVLTELLSSGMVEIGEEKELRAGVNEFVAWRGTVPERIERAKNAVRDALGQDKQFAYWLCRRDTVDRYE